MPCPPIFATKRKKISLPRKGRWAAKPLGGVLLQNRSIRTPPSLRDTSPFRGGMSSQTICRDTACRVRRFMSRYIPLKTFHRNVSKIKELQTAHKGGAVLFAPPSKSCRFSHPPSPCAQKHERREFRRLRTATQRATRPLRTPRQLEQPDGATVPESFCVSTMSNCRKKGRTVSAVRPSLVCICIPEAYSHSIVAGGFVVISYTTRLMFFTSLTIRAEMTSSTSYGIRAKSAVMKSVVVTPRSASV